MFESKTELIQSMQELTDFHNSMCEQSDKDRKLLERYCKKLTKVLGQKYVDKLANIRKIEADKKVVTSIAIYDHNQKFIKKLQSEAKKSGFTLTKENIVNIALYGLEQESMTNKHDVMTIVDNFYINGLYPQKRNGMRKE